MKKNKKKLSEKKKTKNPTVHATMLHAVGKIRALDDRLRGLVRYTEYLAEMLDISVDYTEFLASELLVEKSTNSVTSFGRGNKRNFPRFRDFRKSKNLKIDRPEHGE